MVINWILPDTRQQARMTLENSVITHAMDKQSPDADATITLNRSTLDAITMRQKTFAQAAGDGSLKISGNGAKLSELLAMLDEFNPLFDIVTPNKS
jgi:alkyl sulfatase BDS1-like metallo-beta-lactamase superfamily hydrolase